MTITATRAAAILAVGGVTATILAIGWSTRLRLQTEGGGILLAATSGACGGAVASIGRGWRLVRTVGCALHGVFTALVVYYLVRGVLLQSDASPASVAGSGMATVCLLTALASALPERAPAAVRYAACATLAFALLVMSIRGGFVLLR